MDLKDQKKATEALCNEIVRAADQKKAADIIVLELGEISSVADDFVLCTVNSGPQLRAVLGFIEDEVRKNLGRKPLRTDGEDSTDWVVLDYGDVLVHIMSEQTRTTYQLEKLWNDAPSTGGAALLDKINKISGEKE